MKIYPTYDFSIVQRFSTKNISSRVIFQSYQIFRAVTYVYSNLFYEYRAIHFVSYDSVPPSVLVLSLPKATIILFKHMYNTYARHLEIMPLDRIRIQLSQFSIKITSRLVEIAFRAN